MVSRIIGLSIKESSCEKIGYPTKSVDFIILYGVVGNYKDDKGWPKNHPYFKKLSRTTINW